MICLCTYCAARWNFPCIQAWLDRWLRPDRRLPEDFGPSRPFVSGQCAECWRLELCRLLSTSLGQLESLARGNAKEQHGILSFSNQSVPRLFILVLFTQAFYYTCPIGRPGSNASSPYFRLHMTPNLVYEIPQSGLWDLDIQQIYSKEVSCILFLWDASFNFLLRMKGRPANTYSPSIIFTCS